MKKILLILLTFILLIPLNIKAEIKLSLDCPTYEEYTFGQIVECPVYLDSDEEINELSLSAYSESYYSFIPSSDWEISNADELNENSNPKIYLTRKNSTTNLLGKIKYTLLSGVDIQITNPISQSLTPLDPKGRWGYGMPIPNIYIFNGFNTLFTWSKNEYNIEVDNNISELVISDYMLNDKLPFNMYTFASLMQEGYKVYVNDTLLDLNSLESQYNNINKIECYKDGYTCQSIGNDYIKMEMYYNKKEFVSYSYFKIADLEVGNNTIKFVTDNPDSIGEVDFSKEYIFNINRKELNTNIDNDIKVEDNKTNLIINPNTGITISIILSILSLLVIAYLYYKSYENMLN